MASLTATTTTIATTLTKLSFLSLHRTSFRALSPRFRSSLTTLDHHNHRDSPSFSPNHPVTWTPLSRRSDDKLSPHALPPTRSRQTRADKDAPWNAVAVEKKKKAATTTTTTEEPRYSKAARRFYNERFREPPQRLAKVLAAAGVASRRSSEELIFQRKVTVNGTVCDKPQAFMTEIMQLKGGIDYPIPHMHKSKLAAQGNGLLPEYLTANTELVKNCITYVTNLGHANSISELVDEINSAENDLELTEHAGCSNDPTCQTEVVGNITVNEGVISAEPRMID